MSERLNIVKLWIEKADQDLGTAELTHRHIPEYYDTIAFHCQQAVEKYLKSYLVFNDMPVKRTHDLILLLGLISTFEPVDDTLFDNAAELQDYAVEVRYPDSLIELSDKDVRNAIEIARFFRKIFLAKMKIDKIT